MNTITDFFGITEPDDEKVKQDTTENSLEEGEINEDVSNDKDTKVSVSVDESDAVTDDDNEEDDNEEDVDEEDVDVAPADIKSNGVAGIGAADKADRADSGTGLDEMRLHP